MTARRSILAALTVTLFLPFSICSSKLHDLRLQQAVDRGLDGSAGIIPVVDVESAEILAAKNLEVVRQAYELGRTSVTDVLMEQRRYLDVERANTATMKTAYDAHVALVAARGER